jgi:hypothetical protein
MWRCYELVRASGYRHLHGNLVGALGATRSRNPSATCCRSGSKRASHGDGPTDRIQVFGVKGTKPRLPMRDGQRTQPRSGGEDRLS